MRAGRLARRAVGGAEPPVVDKCPLAIRFGLRVNLRSGIEAGLCLSDLTGVTRVSPEEAGQPFRL
jgi:hypothetical protein